MNDINVWLHVDGAEGTTGNARQLRQPQQRKTDAQKLADKRQGQLINASKTFIKGVVSGAASRVGTVTGSQNTQNGINFGMSAVAVGVGLAVNPALTIATTALKIAQTAFDYAWNLKIDNREKERTAARKQYVNSGGR